MQHEQTPPSGYVRSLHRSRQDNRGPTPAPTYSEHVCCAVGNDKNNESKPRWNISVKDGDHAIGSHTPVHTLACYQGVDVVEASFPDRIKSTVYLRCPSEFAKPPVWSVNASKARQSNKYSFQLASSLDVPPQAMSYLARKIVEDASSERLHKQHGWRSDTFVPDTRHVSTPPQVNYTLLNSQRRRRGRQARKEGTLPSGRGACLSADVAHYVPPCERVRRMNDAAVNERRLRQEAANQTLLALYARPDAPSVYKMSNLPMWSALDPVTVATEQAALRNVFQLNPYSIFFQGNTR